MLRDWDDLRGEAQNTDVLPDVLTVEELREGQAGAWDRVWLWIQLCIKETRQNTSLFNLSQQHFVKHFSASTDVALLIWFLKRGGKSPQI